jgi:hypothetical protein
MQNNIKMELNSMGAEEMSRLENPNRTSSGSSM